MCIDSASLIFAGERQKYDVFDSQFRLGYFTYGTIYIYIFSKKNMFFGVEVLIADVKTLVVTVVYFYTGYI